MTNVFRYPIRVYYDDTDAAGVVYHSNYLIFAERARTEWLRTKGYTNPDLAEDHDVILVVRSLSIEYKMAAQLDDELIVETHLEKIGGVTITMTQRIFKGEKEIVTIDLKLASINNEWRAKKIPQKIIDSLIGE